MTKGHTIASAVTAAAMMAGCGSEGGRAQATEGPGQGGELGLTIESPAFEPGGAIPQAHTCDGLDLSPALRFAGTPARTASLALVVDDPDAPRGAFVHWVIWNVQAASEGLPEGVVADEVLPDGSRQGTNGFRRIGYGGPCPPPGPAHRYFFRLYALDAVLALRPRASRAELDQAMTGHVLASAELMGRYARAAR